MEYISFEEPYICSANQEITKCHGSWRSI